MPKLFRLVRSVDLSGVSGTGTVADGVQFDGGRVVMQWRGDVRSISMFERLADVLWVHGHGGATVVEWVEDGNEER